MKRNLPRTLFLSGFLLFLAAVPALTLLLPKRTVSFYENRTLAQRPDLTWQAFESEDYFNDWETWLTDHAVGRTILMKLYTWLRLEVLGQPVVSDIVDAGEVLLERQDYAPNRTYDLSAAADAAVEEAAALQEAADAWGGVVCYVEVPEQMSYYQDHYPDYMASPAAYFEAVDQALTEAMAEHGVTFVSMYRQFREMGCPRELYFATDHHYTIYGALETTRSALVAAGDRLGVELYLPSREDLTFTTLPNPFIGSRGRKLFGLRDLGDVLTLASYTEPIPFTREDNGQMVEPTLAALPATDTEWVAYGNIMGGDVGKTVIDTNRPDLPDVMIIGESYTNAMESLAYASFDTMTSIDPRHYDGDLAEAVEEAKPDVVFIVRDNTACFTLMAEE